MKEISIIIPIYRVEKYVAECLNSIIRQTINHSIVECIIVNDCTPDNSMDVIGQLILDYQSRGGKMPFRIINHTHNMGISASRNDGICAAKGDFVFFIDSDDYLYPDCLKSLYKAHLNHPNADLIIGNVYDETLNTNHFYISRERVVNNLNYLFAGSLAHYTVWNMLIRRDILNKHNIKFKTDVSVSEDDLFNYQLHSSLNEAVILPQTTYFYRKNCKGQSQHSKYTNASKTLKGYLSILSVYEKELQGKCYVGKSFYAFNIANRAVDFLNNFRTDISDVEAQERQLRQIIRNILRKHIRNVRPMLFLMTLLATQPFEWLMKVHLYRRYFDKIFIIYWIPSMIRDNLLIKLKS